MISPTSRRRVQNEGGELPVERVPLLHIHWLLRLRLVFSSSTSPAVRLIIEKKREGLEPSLFLIVAPVSNALSTGIAFLRPSVRIFSAP